MTRKRVVLLGLAALLTMSSVASDGQHGAYIWAHLDGLEEQEPPIALRHIPGASVLWASAPNSRDPLGSSSWGVWRVDLKLRDATRMGRAAPGSLDATVDAGEERAAWMLQHDWAPRHDLIVWRATQPEPTAVASLDDGGLRTALSWSPGHARVGWVYWREPGTPGLRWWSAGSQDVTSVDLPPHSRPTRRAPPIWMADGDEAGVLCREGMAGSYLPICSVRDQTWSAWGRRLDEGSKPEDLLAPHEYRVLGRGVYEYAGQPGIALLGSPDLMMVYRVLLTDEMRFMAPDPDPVGRPQADYSFVGPFVAPKVLSATRDRVAFVARTRGSGDWAIWVYTLNLPFNTTKAIPLPEGVPVHQQVAFGDSGEIYFVAGEPGNWRAMVANPEDGSIQEIAKLPR